MRGFEEYVQRLEMSAEAALNGDDAALESVDFTALLNGAVGLALHESVPATELKERGAFFTGADLRQRALGPCVEGDLTSCVAWDPTCGAGDLLLSYAERLPILPDLYETLLGWGGMLYGNDVEDVFVRAARARLVLAAYHRGARLRGPTRPTFESVLPNIRRGDAITGPVVYPRATDTVLNPPYIQIPAPVDCEWGSGQISAAALIVERCVKYALPHSRLIAILPDVLRSGSRYDAWRRTVERFAEIRRVEIYGEFDPTADVDVFVLELNIRSVPARSVSTTNDAAWQFSAPAPQTLGDVCWVSTGAVVPHRHAEIGSEYPYLHSRNATPYGTVTNVQERRRFTGTVVMPPIVVVRRTSNPNDRHRPVATLVHGEEPVAVENHLLVLAPKHGGLATCEEVMKVLRSGDTRLWLDQRIRTRHLTVSSVAEIPWKRVAGGVTQEIT